jgi:ABC-2 type transport system permease protein
MLFFSGATVPAEIFPEKLRVFSDILPLGVGINLLKDISLGIYDRMLIPVVILIIITVICSFVSVKTFRWE